MRIGNGMTANAPPDLLGLRIGSASVRENLDAAIGSGRLIEHADGSLQLPEAGGQPDPTWVQVDNGPMLDCEFLKHLLFRRAYGEKAVPLGCSECFKVKVALKTIRQLVAAWRFATTVPFRSKWGVDLHNPHSTDIYAGYFYVPGLPAARALHALIHDDVMALGPGIRMTIKRGCSVYEAALGPSDQYMFPPELAEIEAYLKSRFRPTAPSDHLEIAPAHWIDLAFRMGDETYLDFTNGRRLRPSTKSYDP